MKEGNQWAKQYREHGDMNKVTVKRRHSVISQSSEEDDDIEEPYDTLMTEGQKNNGRMTFKKPSDRMTSDFMYQDEVKSPEPESRKFHVNESQPSFGDKPELGKPLPKELTKSFEVRFKEDEEEENERK